MQLTQAQRTTINLLIENMLAANSATPYDAVGYDANQAAFKAYMQVVLGAPLFDAIDRTNQNWNWRGSRTPADDAQAAIDAALAH